MSLLTAKDPSNILRENCYPLPEDREVKARWEKHCFVVTPEKKCYLIEVYSILDDEADALHYFVEIGDPIIRHTAIFRKEPSGWQPIQQPNGILRSVIPGIQEALSA